MPTITIIEPFDDINMIFDTSTGQYRLTEDAITNLLGEDLQIWAGTPENAEAYLEENSDDIYDFISDYSRPVAYQVKKKMIEKYDTLRPIIQKALIRQARYDIRSGAFLIKDQHGVNIEKGFHTDIKALRNDIGISKSSKRVLSRNGLLYLGYLAMPSGLGDD